jgi:hypothetical protein
MTREYFAGTDKAKQKILLRLAKHGITIDDIRTTGMLYKLDPLRHIDQMCDNRATGRRLLQKDLKKAMKARERARVSPSIVAEQNSEESRDGD